MSYIPLEQLARGAEAVAARSEFDQPWIKKLLSDPEKRWTVPLPEPFTSGMAPINIFETTLGANDSIRAHLSFQRPCREPDAIQDWEECWLLAVGPGVNGAKGRSHGGFNALVLDQISGSLAHHSNSEAILPATATITVDFRAEVRTPCVVLVRAWIITREGRKVWIRAVLEDKDGRVCSASKSLFVFPKYQPRL